MEKADQCKVIEELKKKIEDLQNKDIKQEGS